MEEFLIITLATIVATTVGTISGFGSSTVLIPVLLLFLPFTQTLLLAAILHFFNDIWKLMLFRKGVKWKLILGFGVPSVIATYIGARLVFSSDEMMLSQILGAFFIAYAIFLLVHHKFKVQQSSATAITGGAISGFFAGIFGLGGAIRSAFLTTYNLPKEIYIATIGAIALVTDSVRVSTYLIEGARLEQYLLGLVVLIPASFYGAKLGQLIVKKVPQTWFRRFVALFLLLAGLKFLFLP